MKVWIIHWHWLGNDTSGVYPRAYTNKELAMHVLEVLRMDMDGIKTYMLSEIEVLDTTKIQSEAAVEDRPTFAEYWWKRNGGVPHKGVEGVTPLDGLTVRSSNALKQEGVTTIEQLLCWEERHLLMLPGMGRKSVNDIKSYLQSKGLKLKG
jgi:hypothetical protein